MEQQQKKWFIRCIGLLAAAVAAAVLLVWLVDPLFHFHKPFPFISYNLYDERYVNDGILRHFDYNTVIIGTSMAQNFKPSEVEALFGGTRHFPAQVMQNYPIIFGVHWSAIKNCRR